jgi:hypothetical protein
MKNSTTNVLPVEIRQAADRRRKLFPVKRKDTPQVISTR